jgi:hypothetical protein
LTEKRIINKETFYLSTKLVDEVDEDILRFNISEKAVNNIIKETLHILL